MTENKMLRVHGLGKFFYQWDTGRKLVVNDEKCSQVHFSNDHFEKALVCKVYDEGDLRVVDVPNILLQECASIKAYLNSFDDNGRLTTYCEIFQVIGRSRPEEYVYTETETVSYSYLDKRLDHLEGEGLANAVADYLEKNPPQAGATKEEAAQIQQNKTDIAQLTQDKLDASKLPEAVNDALAQAKASGEFKGDPGEPGQPGEPGKTPEKGKDYLTDADKQEIAELAADMVDAQPKTLVVTLSDTDNGDYIASHSASEIASHVANGGDAYILHNDYLYRNDGGDSEEWWFVSMRPIIDQMGAEIEIEYIGVYDDKYTTFEHSVAPGVDDTLTASGKAADAKAVGDALAGKISNRGTEERPSYNDLQLAFLDDVPTEATLERLIGNALTQYDASIKQHIKGVANGAWNQVTEYVDTAIGNLDIPTDDHINSLINTALGVIENGTY